MAHVRVLLYLMLSPLVVEVCGEVQLEVRVHPRSSVTKGMHYPRHSSQC